VAVGYDDDRCRRVANQIPAHRSGQGVDDRRVVAGPDHDEVRSDLGEALPGCSVHDFAADRDRSVTDQVTRPGDLTTDHPQHPAVVLAALDASDKRRLPGVDQVHRVSRVGVLDGPQQSSV
jgi:hypothetical protein